MPCNQHLLRLGFFLLTDPTPLTGSGEVPGNPGPQTIGGNMPEEIKKDAEGKNIVTEENAVEVARLEMAEEKKEDETPEEKATRETQERDDQEAQEGQEREDQELVDAKEEDLDETQIAKRKEIIEKREAAAKPKEGDEKSDEQILAAKPEDLNDDEKTKRETLIEGQKTERERLLAIDDKDLTPEDKPKKEIVLLQLETEKREAFDVRVTDYAEANKIPVEDARKTLESVAKIREKYEGDPDKIAEAALNLQRMVAQKDEEIQAAKDVASQPRMPESAKEWEVAIKEKGMALAGGKVLSWEEVVKAYREDNEDTTDGVQDDQVLKMVSKEISAQQEAHFVKQSSAIKKLADEKRDKLITSIPEGDKQYAADVKKLLKTVPDRSILKKDYSIEHSIRWARGGHFTPDKVAELEKAAEAKGFERGQAKGKIVTGPGGGGKPPKGSKTVLLTEGKKNDAREMFPGLNDKEAFAAYAEVQEDRKKNKK